MQNEEGQNMDLYIPRKCFATNRLITSKDHASVQINIGHLDESGTYTGKFTTFALCGFVQAQVFVEDVLMGFLVGSLFSLTEATDPFNERWQSVWIITAFWDILAFGFLCIICYLWAPSQSSQRYAYSEEKGEEFDDEETQSLTRGKPEGDISLGKQDNNSEEDEEEEDKRE